LAPRLKKRMASNLGGQSATLGTNVSAFYKYPNIIVLAFISNSGPNNKPKMLKVGPSFIGPDS